MQKGHKMKIKRPVNFAVGIFCLLGFILNVVNRRDIFDIVLTAICAVGNITFGLID